MKDKIVTKITKVISILHVGYAIAEFERSIGPDRSSNTRPTFLESGTGVVHVDVIPDDVWDRYVKNFH